MGATSPIQSNIGNAGSTIAYPFKAYVDGTNIITPVMYPVVTTAFFGSSHSYLFTNSKLLISRANSTTTETSEYTFDSETRNSSYTISPIFVTASNDVALIGNNEVWSNDDIVITATSGLFGITFESENTTSSTTTAFPARTAYSVNNTSQYAYEGELFASNANTVKTTVVGSTAPRNFALRSYSTG
jgi:hypothetical protein